MLKMSLSMQKTLKLTKEIAVTAIAMMTITAATKNIATEASGSSKIFLAKKSHPRLDGFLAFLLRNEGLT
jgi:hypothetical protein